MNKDVSQVRPCGYIHPLPCGLDRDCEVPIKYYDENKTDREVWSDFTE